jgi:maltose/moltooligosaccharide transporter
MLWIMDASFNIALGPALALVGDMLPNKQRSTGFAMQSFFIGVSAVVASALPWILSNWFGVSNTAPEGVVPPSVVYAFYIGGGMLLATVLWSSFTTHEYTPARLAGFTCSEPRAEQKKTLPDRALLMPGLICLTGGLAASLAIFTVQLAQQLYILALGIATLGALQLMAEHMRRRGQTSNGFYQVTQDLLNMPKTMKQLALVQFLSWFALFSMWIYGTAAVTSYHFHTQDTASALYNQGADWVGVLFAAYNGFAAVAAIFIPLMIRASSRKITHMICLCLGAAGLMSFVWIRDPDWLLAPMIAVGFAWASILSLPYAILANSLPANKMGVYAGIFNFFIVIPQILAASVLALVVHHLFNGQSIYALVSGGLFMLLAATATAFLDD